MPTAQPPLGSTAPIKTLLRYSLVNRLAQNQMLLFLENQEQLQAYDNRFPWSVHSIRNNGVANCSDYSHGKTTPAESEKRPPIFSAGLKRAATHGIFTCSSMNTMQCDFYVVVLNTMQQGDWVARIRWSTNTTQYEYSVAGKISSQISLQHEYYAAQTLCSMNTFSQLTRYSPAARATWHQPGCVGVQGTDGKGTSLTQDPNLFRFSVICTK